MSQQPAPPQEPPSKLWTAGTRTRKRAAVLLAGLLPGILLGIAASPAASPYTQRVVALLRSLYWPATSRAPRLVTLQELAARDGSQGDPLWLAVCGQVFDVTRGRKHYGPGGGYSFFAGRDGSAAFVTGAFNETGLTDDVSGISDEDLAGLENWRAFYHSDYSYVGILAGGRFYDAAGEALPPVARVQAAVASARITRAAAAAADALTPSCAASWTADDGGAVWWTGEAQGNSGDYAEEDGAILKSRVAELAAKGHGVRPYPDCELTAPRCRTAPSQQEL